MADVRPERLRRTLHTAARTILPIALAFLFGSVFLLFLHASPAKVYSVMIGKSLSSFDLVLRRAMVLMLSGLAVAVPLRAGMFNMGGEGQIAVGGLIAAVVGSMDIGLPPVIHAIVALLVAATSGAMLAGFSAWLSIRRNVNEVISTIMMNNILAYIVTWLVMNPFRGSEFSPQTKFIRNSAKIPGFPELEFSWGLPIAVTICVLIWYLIERTPKGLEMKAAGLNPTAARYQGIHTSTMGMYGMVLGGVCAALGGALEVLGGSYAYSDGYFVQYGYDGIAISFMAGNNPLGIILSSVFMAIIRVGSLVVSRKTGVSTYFVSIFQGIVIALLVTPSLTDTVLSLFRRRKEVKA